MFSGSVSKMAEGTLASAATIFPKSDVVRVTGSTQINQIMPALGTALDQLLVLVPTDGAITLGTSGNIAVGVSMPQNRATFLVWSKLSGKWIIGN